RVRRRTRESWRSTTRPPTSSPIRIPRANSSSLVAAFEEARHLPRGIGIVVKASAGLDAQLAASDFVLQHAGRGVARIAGLFAVDLLDIAYDVETNAVHHGERTHVRFHL